MTFVQADLFEGSFDAVLSNPPYVEDGAELPPTVARHEPPEALFGGEDGLDVVRRLVARCSEGADVAVLALEVGAGQADTVATLVSEAAYGAVEVRRDLAGIERVVIGRR